MYLLFLLIAGRFLLGGRDCHKENPQLILWVSHSLHHITTTYPLWSCGSRQISSTFFEEAKLLGPFLDSFSTPRVHSGHTDGGGYRCNSELLSSVQIWLRSITMTTLVKSSKLPLLLAENEMERLNIGQTSENWQYYVIFVNSCVLQWRYCRFSLLILLSLCSWLEWTWSRQTWFINCYALSLLTHTRV